MWNFLVPAINISLLFMIAHLSAGWLGIVRRVPDKRDPVSLNKDAACKCNWNGIFEQPCVNGGESASRCLKFHHSNRGLSEHIFLSGFSSQQVIPNLHSVLNIFTTDYLHTHTLAHTQTHTLQPPCSICSNRNLLIWNIYLAPMKYYM